MINQLKSIEQIKDIFKKLTEIKLNKKIPMNKEYFYISKIISKELNDSFIFVFYWNGYYNVKIYRYSSFFDSFEKSSSKKEFILLDFNYFHYIKEYGHYSDMNKRVIFDSILNEKSLKAFGFKDSFKDIKAKEQTSLDLIGDPFDNVPSITDFKVSDKEIFSHISKPEKIVQIKKSTNPHYKENDFILIKKVNGVNVIVGKIILDKTYGDPRGFE